MSNAERTSMLICILFQSRSTPSIQYRNLGFQVENREGFMSLFLVAMQDLCDVSSTGSWCQGISCCVAEADICRSTEPWPGVSLHRRREKGRWLQLSHVTTLCPISPVLISLTATTHLPQYIISLWFQPL